MSVSVDTCRLWLGQHQSALVLHRTNHPYRGLHPEAGLTKDGVSVLGLYT